MACEHIIRDCDNAIKQLQEERTKLKSMYDDNTKLLDLYDELLKEYACVINNLADISVNGHPYDYGDTQCKYDRVNENINDTISQRIKITNSIETIDENIRGQEARKNSSALCAACKEATYYGVSAKNKKE